MSPEHAAALLAAVEQSPRLVALHQREAWCGLYAQDGAINDPVGSAPHLGHAAIGRFYDTFIAPNHIRFHVEHDVAWGNTVVRDLIVETRMLGGIQMLVPMHLRYELVEEGGALKIQRLGAHWELPAMIRQLLGKGLGGLRVSMALGARMVRCLGLGGVLGFVRGFAGVGSAGKRTAHAFFEAAEDGKTEVAAALLAPGCRLESPYGTELTTEVFLAGLGDVRIGKMLASGPVVSVTLFTAAGRGVAFLRFDMQGRIAAAEVFVSAAA